ncbi:transposase [Mesomycoplasma dispar]|uniref:Transposase n=1 Tax=Mesomycoplasma dispar TaxID=86660 RepID=A0ABM6PRU0_9BACT|nr:transposase [Mesomycoplasma dispar]
MNKLIRKNTKKWNSKWKLPFKITYLTFENASEKWQRQIRNWHIIKKQLEIIFPNQLNNVKLN